MKVINSMNPFKKETTETTTYTEINKLLNVVESFINNQKIAKPVREYLEDFAAQTKNMLNEKLNTDTYVNKLNTLISEVRTLLLKIEAYILQLIREQNLNQKVTTQSDQIDFDAFERDIHAMYNEPQTSQHIKELLEQLFQLLALRTDLIKQLDAAIKQLAETNQQLGTIQNSITQTVTTSINNVTRAFGNFAAKIPATLQNAFNSAQQKVQQFTNQTLPSTNWTPTPVISTPTPTSGPLNTKPSPTSNSTPPKKEKLPVPVKENINSHPFKQQYDDYSHQQWSVFKNEFTRQKELEKQPEMLVLYDKTLGELYITFKQLRNDAWEELARNPHLHKNYEVFDKLAKLTNSLESTIVQTLQLFNSVQQKASVLLEGNTAEFVQQKLRKSFN